MKRLLILLLCCLLLSGCSFNMAESHLSTTAVPGTSPILPEAVAAQSLATSNEALLYYRYYDEPYLAPERRTILQSPSQAYEMALLTALIAGPSGRDDSLNTLFPEGTQVLSTARQGRTLFVTLSGEIMDRYADEAENLSSENAGTESILRRQLCMQSLVATVTENCDVDEVQILVEQGDNATESMRMRQKYFLTTSDDTLLTTPQTRQDNFILTPENTLNVILNKWEMRDWSRLYRYMASVDASNGETLMSQSDFITAMEALPQLTGFTFEGGSVSADGQTVTYSLNVSMLTADGQTLTRTGRVVRLCRENDCWKITFSQLTDWLEGVA